MDTFACCVKKCHQLLRTGQSELTWWLCE